MSIEWERITRETEALVDETRGSFTSAQLETILDFLESECYLALDSIYEFWLDNNAPVDPRHRRELLRLFHESGFLHTDVHERRLEALG